MTERYFLKITVGAHEAEWEVTKEEWVEAERAAGFRPKVSSDHPDYMKVCATGGFTSGPISGRIEYIEV